MLLEFKLSNFRSFCGEQVFAYPGAAGRGSAGVRRRRFPATPEHHVAVIFGPNGAGKTNFIRGLAALQDLVLNSATCSDADYAEHWQPSLFDAGQVKTATRFEIELLLEGTRYLYTLAYDAQQVLFERLLVYKTGKPQRWFEREATPQNPAVQWQPFSPYFTGSRELWRHMTRPQALFLTTAARAGCPQLQPLYRWFTHGLAVRFGNEESDPEVLAACIRDPRRKAAMLQVFRAVDLMITDLRIAEPMTGRQVPHGPRVELLLQTPGGTAAWLDSQNVARGTVRLLNLLGPLLASLEQRTLLAFDEFDVGLHPLVARSLVQFVKRSAPTDGCSQQLFTSHDVALMAPEILDQEEVWLMERDRDRGSHLLSVAERGPRKGEQLARGYLRGRYGAVPAILEDRFPEAGDEESLPQQFE